MNALFKLAALAGPIAFAGCAASAPVPPPPPDHPASPQAPAAAVPDRSNTLALEAGDVPAAGHEHVKPAESAATSQPVAAYTCPHHPEVTQATPGTCPRCKMKLRPAEQATPAEPADAKRAPDHSGHEGHVGHEGHGGHRK